MRGGRKQPSVFRVAVREGQKYLEGKRNLCDSVRAFLSSAHHFTISFQPKLSLVFIFCQQVSPHYVFDRLFFGYFSLHIYYCQNQEALETYEGKNGTFFRSAGFRPI